MAVSNKCLFRLTGVFASLYVLNRYILIPALGSPEILVDYGGDFLALPVYIPLAVLAAKRLSLLSSTFSLSFSHVLQTVVVFSLLFEGLFPLILTSATPDAGDVLAYLAGGCLLWVLDQMCCSGQPIDS